MIAVRSAVTASLIVLAMLLLGLSVLVGLAPVAWVVGIGCGLGLVVTVDRGLARRDGARLGPADLVTLTRATLACAVAALVTDDLLGQGEVAALVVTAAIALALDAVDGRVARATGTQSSFGARFDGEADAFLILVLSVHVAQSYGAWVLAIGATRYVFGAAGWALPWLRDQLPPRPWRKVVAAVQGVVLLVAAAEVAPRPATVVALVVALTALAESFGRDVLWLVRHRHDAPSDRSARTARLPAS